MMLKQVIRHAEGVFSTARMGTRIGKQILKNPGDKILTALGRVFFRELEQPCLSG